MNKLALLCFVLGVMIIVGCARRDMTDQEAMAIAKVIKQQEKAP